MTTTTRPFLLAGVATTSTDSYTVTCPYDAQPVATLWRAGEAHLDQAIATAYQAVALTKQLAAHQRATARTAATAPAATATPAAAKATVPAAAKTAANHHARAPAAIPAASIPTTVPTSVPAATPANRHAIGRAAPTAAVGIRRASIAGGASAAAATASRISGTYSSAGPAGWAKAGALARRARTGKIICFIMNSPFTCQLEHRLNL